MLVYPNNVTGPTVAGVKGHGKSVNYNIPGLPNSSIDSLPHNGRAYYRDRPDQAPIFCSHLQQALAAYPVGQCKFENMDVCQVRWSPEDMAMLLEILKQYQAYTKRFMAFKCGLTDVAMSHLSVYLETLSPHNLPSEIHLSHNEITHMGVERLLSVVEQKRQQLSVRPPPIWLRIENNPIERGHFDAYVAQGRIVYSPKVRDDSRMNNRTASLAMPALFGNVGAQAVQPTVRAALPSFQGTTTLPSFQGTTAVPSFQGTAAVQFTAPALAPLIGQLVNEVQHGPAALHQSTALPAQTLSAGAYAQPQPQEQQPLSQQQLQQHLQRQLQQPLHLASSGAAMQTVNAAAADIANSLGASAATSRVDRSRSPTRRPTGEPGLPLPPGWEEHWSEEHRLPYFWNHVTGQSIWERPQH